MHNGNLFLSMKTFPSYHSLSYSPGYNYYAAHHAPTFHHLTTPYYAAALPHLNIPAFGLRGLPYNGLPYSGLPSYNGIPSYAYTGLPSLAYNTLSSASAEEEKE